MTSTVKVSAVPGPRPPIASPAPTSGERPVRATVRLLTDLEPSLEPDPPVPRSASASAVQEARRHADEPRPERGLRAEVSGVLRLVLEVLDRRRPPAQLAGLVSGSVLRYLTAAAGRPEVPAPRRARPSRAGQPGPARLRSVRLCCPDARVAEVSAVWRYRGGYRALAARFEATPPEDAACAGRWRCTVLRLG